MRIAVLGSGMVGKSLGARLAEQGHDIVMGTRDASKLTAWASSMSGKIRVAGAAEAAGHGEIVVNATKGDGSVDALTQAGAANLEGKVLMDVSNPLDFSKGMPPTLLVKDTDSLGEQIQRAFPGARVVKTLNTLTAALMLNPGALAGGDHSIFVSGNDPAAKGTVTELLRTFGWRDIIDLGDITTARGTEMYLALWVRLYGSIGTPQLNVKIVR